MRFVHLTALLALLSVPATSQSIPVPWITHTQTDKRTLASVTTFTTRSVTPVANNRAPGGKDYVLLSVIVDLDGNEKVCLDGRFKLTSEETAIVDDENHVHIVNWIIGPDATEMCATTGNDNESLIFDFRHWKNTSISFRTAGSGNVSAEFDLRGLDRAMKAVGW